jgi:hypothetical protein
MQGTGESTKGSGEAFGLGYGDVEKGSYGQAAGRSRSVESAPNHGFPADESLKGMKRRFDEIDRGTESGAGSTELKNMVRPTRPHTVEMLTNRFEHSSRHASTSYPSCTNSSLLSAIPSGHYSSRRSCQSNSWLLSGMSITR